LIRRFNLALNDTMFVAVACVAAVAAAVAASCSFIHAAFAVLFCNDVEM
jgi:hypothetical protein